MPLNDYARHDHGVPSPVPYVLLLEDEPIIALDIENTLDLAGYPVKMCTSRNEALDWLQSSLPVAAIVDLHLKDGSSADVVAELQVREVPVIICSGSHPSDLPDDLGPVTWIAKPHSEHEIIATLKETIRIGSSLQTSEVDP